MIRMLSLALAAAVLVGSLAPAVGCKRNRREKETPATSGYAPRDPQAAKLFTMSVDEARQRYQDPLAITALRERAIEMLLEFSQSESAEVRANVLQALALAGGARAEQPLRAGLTDPNEGVRAIAAFQVGELQHEELATAVAPLVRSESPYVRASAAFALAKCNRPDDKAMTGLVDLLLTHPSPKVRAHCALLLGKLGNPSALGPLREAAAKPPARASQTEVRMMDLQVAEAMVHLGEENQIEIVRAALYPSRVEDLEIAALATQILGDLDDKASVDALINITAYRQEQGGRPMSAEVRLGAAAALAKLGHREGNFIAEEFKSSMIPAIRAQAAHVYGFTGQAENLARLEASLADPYPPVRIAAAAGILRISTRLNGK